MDFSDKKTILIDIVTGLVLLGVLVFGYITFVPSSETTAPGTEGSVVTTSDVVAETIAISDSIAQTKEDLQDLASAVTAATLVFNGPDFRSLEDFSKPIPAETVGRDYPFTKTDWKLKFEAIEEAAQKAASPSQAATTVQPAQTTNNISEESMNEVQGI